MPEFFDPHRYWPHFDDLGHRNFSADMEALFQLAREAGGTSARIVEVGSFVGLSALALARAGATVWCVDTWEGSNDAIQKAYDVHGSQQVYLTFCKNTASQLHRSIHPLRIDSATAACSWPGDSPLDLVLLDGSHEYDDVKCDAARWWLHLKPGGILALHDYGFFEGVTAAADEMGMDGVLGVSVAWRKKA